MEAQKVTITPPKFGFAKFVLIGTAPLVINAFSAKAREDIRKKHEAGSTSKKGKKREPKNFQELYENARHKSTEGWDGIAAPAFRCALISACRMVGFQMTRAKLSLFIVADGFDAVDGIPLVRITKGEPKYSELPVRNETGVVDIRPRPMWAPGWEAQVTVKWDADQFTSEDVANLLARVGEQVGVGEGRPDSKNSAGQGWGLFQIKEGLQ